MKRFQILYSIRRRAWTRWLLVRFDPLVKLKIRDVTFRVSMRLFRHSGYAFKSSKIEPKMHRLFLLLIKKVKISHFVDVGANIGVYTWMAKSADQALRVTAFEPDPGNFLCLESTIKNNHIDGVVLVNKAVSEISGSASLRLDRLSGQTGSIIEGFPNSDELLYNIPIKKHINVGCIALDAILKDVDFQIIKIDVEGAELFVLKGGMQSIIRLNPYILIEVAEWNIDAVRDFAEECGYTCYRINDAEIGACLNLFMCPNNARIPEECFAEGLVEVMR
jgi:FkbM family methyltransferase